MVVVRDDQVFK